jgi:hypothetical protein
MRVRFRFDFVSVGILSTSAGPSFVSKFGVGTASVFSAFLVGRAGVPICADSV